MEETSLDENSFKCTRCGRGDLFDDFASTESLEGKDKGSPMSKWDDNVG